MPCLLPVLLIAVTADGPLDVRYPGATEVFSCTFGPRWDANYDAWPDHWTRRQGKGYPHYVSVNLSDEPSPAGDRCLRVELDGGAAAAYSPPIEIGPLYGYVVEAYLKTEDLTHDRAYLSLSFLDRSRKRLTRHVSEKVRHSDGWRKVRIGPAAPESDETALMVVGLHLEPGRREDLRGAVCFDDIWVGRLPRMSLTTDRPHNLFLDDHGVEVVCRASGFSQPQQAVTLQLTDVFGNELARSDRKLHGCSVERNTGFSLDSLVEDPAGLAGETRWRPTIPGPGFYRVRATMPGSSPLLRQRRLTLAVLQSRPRPPNAEFGWSLPRGDHPLSLDALAALVPQAGVGWIKYPLWSGDSADDAQAERLVTFIERMAQQGIRPVGLLADPTDQLRKKYGHPRRLPAADLFAPQPEAWYPSLEPILARLATRVRWWQLGGDRDASFVDCPNLVAKTRQIKTVLDRISQDANLGMAWPWIDPFPKRPDGSRQTTPEDSAENDAAGQAAPWRFLALSADPPMTSRELARCLDATENAHTARWVVLRPISRKHYAPEVRATDLVNRMMAARIHGADAVFCSDPFDDDHGLMNEDGTPGELLLPWRTAALALAGTEHLGRLQLPGGSPNQVFVRDNHAILVVWNQQPTEEVLYLGPDARQRDLWGRETAPEKRGHRHVIHVDRTPTIVTGMDLEATRLRLSFSLNRTRLPSVFDHPHKNSLRLVNHFDRGVAGRLDLALPEGWLVQPGRLPFRLAEGEPVERPLTITLPYNTNAGRHPVRVDVTVEGRPARTFSIYRSVDVGLGSVSLTLRTRLNEQGDLEVEQQLVNRGDGPVSFRCLLFIPGRQRRMTQVLSLPRGQDLKTYRIPDGRELLGGSLWLRAEELDGPRVLNYRFTAEK